MWDMAHQCLVHHRYRLDARHVQPPAEVVIFLSPSDIFLVKSINVQKVLSPCCNVAEPHRRPAPYAKTQTSQEPVGGDFSLK